MRAPRDSSLAPAALGFAAGTALLVAFLGLAFAVPFVRGAAAFVAPIVPVVLFGVPLVALVRVARGGSAPAISPRAWATLSGLAIPGATFALALVLIEAWTAARSNGSYAGGLVPVSDAGAYFAGAERLLQDGTLDAWNSRRPLNAALLAARTALAGGDFRGALLLQAALTASTSVLAARALAADYGRIAGLFLFAGLFVFGGIFVATTMSESLGLSLGACSFALLWHGMRTKGHLTLGLGFAVCAMALNARAGPFLMLPCLVVWAALTHAAPADGARRRVNRGSLGAALVGIAAGFAVNRAVSSLYGGAKGGANSNFSYTLYGLAHGGVGWERAFSDFPELHAMDDAEAGSFIYARALGEMHEHPMGLVIGLARNVECFVLSMSEKLSLGLLDGHPVAEWVFALVWGAGAVLLVRRTFRVHGGDRGLWLVTATVVGVLASVPVIYMDGRERVFAASVPFVVAGLAVAAASLGRAGVRRAPGSAEEHARWVRGVAVFACVVTLAALAGPRLGHAAFGRAAATDEPLPPCAEGMTPLRLATRSGLPHVDLVAAGPRPLAPQVDARTFHAGIVRDVNLGSPAYATELLALHEGETLVAAFDLDARRTRHLALSTATFAALGSAAEVCAELGPKGADTVARAVLVKPGNNPP